MKLVLFTQPSGKIPVYINPEQVVRVRATGGDQITIDLTSGMQVVRETMDDVVKALAS